MIKVAKILDIEDFLRKESKKKTWTFNGQKDQAYLYTKNYFSDRKNKLVSEIKFTKIWNKIFNVNEKIGKHNTIVTQLSGSDGTVYKDLEKVLVPLVKKEFEEKVLPALKILLEDKIKIKVKEYLLEILNK